MSTLLEQAIVDATALREAALKNAEAAVIEKYSDQIKDAVETMLFEQEEPASALEEEPVVDDMPLAANDEEKLCPCPDDDEEIEINFDELSRQMDIEGEQDPESEDDMAADVLGMEEPEEEEPLAEDVNIDEDLLNALVEKLTVDTKPVKSGWAGTPESVMELAEEELLAAAQDTEYKEKRDAMRKAMESLQESYDGLKQENENLNAQLADVNAKSDTLKQAVLVLKEKLDDLNVSNAKLLYTNRVLTNDSLNERQKNHIVESLSKSDSVEEAKTIYETLQNAVSGNRNDKKQLNSLSEAVNKTSSTIILSARERQEPQQNNSSLDRWKLLAGIDKNKN